MLCSVFTHLALLFAVVACLSVVYGYPVSNTDYNKALMDDQEFRGTLPSKSNSFGYYPLFLPGLSEHKRGPQLSINQDLMSIASMMRNDANRRKMEGAQSFLLRIGKRAPIPYPSDYQAEDVTEYDDYQGEDSISKRSADTEFVLYPLERLQKGREHKRGPQLSINQDLMSIASMMRNDANRRKMEGAQSFLSRIGKRAPIPYPSDYQAEDVTEYDDYQGEDSISKRSADTEFVRYPFKRPQKGRSIPSRK